MIVQLNKKRARLTARQGQSTLEYAVLIIVIIAALAAIQTYIKRGVQGRLKSASDDIGDQYSPGNTNVITAERTHTNELQTFGLGAGGSGSVQGLQRTAMLEDQRTNMVQRAVVVNNEQEYWGQ